MSNVPISTAATSLAKHLGAGGKMIVQNLNPLEVVREYLSFLKASSEQKTERDRIAAERAVALSVIEFEKTIILEYFNQRFAERREALDTLFEVLQSAVRSKDEHGMDTALSGILGILKDNPLSDFDTFRRARENRQIIEI